MEEKNLTLISTLGVIILGVIGPLIGWFCGGCNLESNSKETIRQMLNFEITLILVSFLTLIPLIGLIVPVIVFVTNIIFAIKSFNATKNNAPFKAPGYEFIK